MNNILAVVNNFKNLPKKNRLLLIGIAVFSVSVVIFSIAWTQREPYHILFSNLTQEDMGLVVEKLKGKKIKYKIEGEKILVPSDKVYETRIQLAAQGVPTGGGIGFELFDKTDFGTTDFVQKLNYQRALQGEITRTITALSEVESARVHIVIPEKTVFSEQKSKPSASILLKLKRGKKLTENQVEGIVNLVSNSVEGLDHKDVTIVDTNGEMLTKQKSQDSNLTNTQLEFQKNYEKEIEHRVLSILEPVVGQGKVRAKANVEIDFTKIERTEERFDPEGQVIRSMQKNSEKSDVGGAGGVPGVNSNVPTKVAQTPTILSKGQTEKQNEIINYEISKVISHVVVPTVGVKRQTVAVVVDGNYSIDKNSNVKKYIPRTAEEIKHYEDLVKKAIGFAQERGDEVKVVNMEFQDIAQEEPKQSTIQIYMPHIISFSKNFIPLIAFVVLILFVIRPMIKSLVKTEEPKDKKAKEEIEQLPSEDRVSISTEKLAPVLSPQEQLINWAQLNPEQAASFIKKILEEK